MKLQWNLSRDKLLNFGCAIFNLIDVFFSVICINIDGAFYLASLWQTVIRSFIKILVIFANYLINI